MDRLDDLTVLVEVVDCGNLSVAAARLGLSPSAVSRRLSALETRLGARLLARTTRRVALTDVGAAFCLRARAALAAVEEAERSVLDMNAAPRGVLRVMAPVAFGQAVLARLLPAYQADNPEVSLDVVLSDRPARPVEEGIDVAIQAGRLADSSLIARRIGPLRRIVLGSPAYLARAGVPATPAELAQHNCLAFVVAGTRQDWDFAQDGVRSSIRPAGTMQADNAAVLCRAAVEGLGLVRLDSFAAAEEIAAGTLVPVLEGFEPGDESVFAVYPAARHLSPKVRSFIDLLLAWRG